MVADILKTGKENAVTGRELCEILDINSRELLGKIEKERRAGAPICANSGTNPGYYLAANKNEMTEYLKSLRRRGGNLFKTYRACKITLDKLP